MPYHPTICYTQNVAVNSTLTLQNPIYSYDNNQFFTANCGEIIDLSDNRLVGEVVFAWLVLN
ncbi:MAG TPA: hypothetical protein VKA91_02945 [Nitrososphaeraceae archaeon]|nr:hypothetical protein [Nitrososphaeraceae archaeon]